MSSRIRYTDSDEIIARADAIERRLLDSVDQSDFLKLAVLADREIAFGSTAINLVTDDPAKSVNVSHGLDGTPVAAVATTDDSRVNVSVGSVTSSAIALAARNVFNATSINVTVYWIAIG